MATQEQIETLANLTYMSQNTGVPTSQMKAAYEAVGIDSSDPFAFTAANAMLQDAGYNPGSNPDFFGSNSPTTVEAAALDARWNGDAAPTVNDNLANKDYLASSVPDYSYGNYQPLSASNLTSASVQVGDSEPVNYTGGSLTGATSGSTGGTSTGTSGSTTNTTNPLGGANVSVGGSGSFGQDGSVNLDPYFTSLSDTLSTNFGTVTDNQQNIYDKAADTNSLVKTGFGDLTLKDVRDEVATQADNVTTATNDARDVVTNRIGNFENEFATFSDLYKANYKALSDDVTRNYDTSVAGFGALDQAVGDVGENLGNFRTAFDNFGEQYNKDAAQALKQRNALQEQVVGSSDKLGTMIAGGTVSSAVPATSRIAATPMSLMASPMSLSAAPAQLSAATETPTTPEAKFAQSIQKLRELATTYSDQISDDMQQRFMEVGAAFDEGGKLVGRTVSEDGFATVRSVDEAGNLLFRKFDPTGKAIGTGALNVDRVIAESNNVTVQ